MIEQGITILLGDYDDLNRRKVTIHTPQTVIQKYVDLFSESESTLIKEKLLAELFRNPSACNMDEQMLILLKCTVLNSYYSTNILDIVSIAKRIYRLNTTYFVNGKGIVDYLLCDELDKGTYQQLVNLIAYTKQFDNSTNRYSFASKYCNWHAPSRFPIVDSYAKGLLFRILENTNKNIYGIDLDDYQQYCRVYEEFASMYCRKSDGSIYSYKEIDEYLWKYATTIFDFNSPYNVLSENTDEKDSKKIEKELNEKGTTAEKARGRSVIRKYYQKEFAEKLKIDSNYENAETLAKKAEETIRNLCK